MTASTPAPAPVPASVPEPDLLRFITCGSVDDGKSTLIGRLLYESQQVLSDQMDALRRDSARHGSRGSAPDFALLVDGLAAEREQGITIDVAYRYFSGQGRRFIVADTPGHEQYTRNMVTGASTADLAVLLVDARKGLLTQTRRHSAIAALLGIRRIVLAVNKMDLVGYSREAFEAIVSEYLLFGARLGLTDVTAIPLVAVDGENIVTPGPSMPWYQGPTLLQHLERVPPADDLVARPLRMAVQWVNRPDSEFRGLAGRIASGRVRPGDAVRVLPSGREARVARIVLAEGDASEAVAGQSITLTLDPPVDAGRGALIAARADAPEVAAHLEATLVWLHEAPLLQGRTYLMKCATQLAVATVAPLKHRLNVDSLETLAAETLNLNDIGVAELQLDRPIAFEPYAASRELGSFILIDRVSHETVGCGMIRFALRRSQNVHWQALEVDKALRARLKGQRPCVLWLTGLSGSGKSTIANLVEKQLAARGHHTYLLDGDNVRHGLNKDLGFTPQDRVENIRRVAETARLMVDAGLIVLVAFISPYRAERRMARELFAADEFVEVFVDTPLAVAEQRDPKGLYRKARSGALRNFTGIDAPYEVPEHPELRIDTTQLSAERAAELVVQRLLSAAPAGTSGT